MYTLAEVDVEYLGNLTQYIKKSKCNEVTNIIKGLKFLALKGANTITAEEEQIIVYTKDATFCDADVIYLETYGWLAVPDKAGYGCFTYLLLFHGI